MAPDPLADQAEIEIICPGCGYRLKRSAGRLRRETPVVCPNCGCEIVHSEKNSGSHSE